MGKLQIKNNVKKLLADISKEKDAVASVGSSFSEPLRMYQATSVAYSKLVYAASLIKQAEALLSSAPEIIDGVPLKLYHLICDSNEEPGFYSIDNIVSAIGASDSYRRVDNLVSKILKPCQQMFDAEMQWSFDFDIIKEDGEKEKSKVTGVFITPRPCNPRLSPDVVTSFLQAKIRPGKEEYEQKNIDDNKENIERFCHLPDAVQLWESCMFSVNRGNVFSMETGAISTIYAPVGYMLHSIRKCLEKADSERATWASATKSS